MKKDRAFKQTKVKMHLDPCIDNSQLDLCDEVVMLRSFIMNHL